MHGVGAKVSSDRCRRYKGGGDKTGGNEPRSVEAGIAKAGSAKAGGPARKKAWALNARRHRSAAVAAAKKSSSAMTSLPVGLGRAPQTTITTCSLGLT